MRARAIVGDLPHRLERLSETVQALDSGTTDKKSRKVSLKDLADTVADLQDTASDFERRISALEKRNGIKV
jgi:hypothetical protein